MNFSTLLSTKTSTLRMTTDTDDLVDENLFDECMNLDLIKHPKICIYGKEATMHRSIGFFSNESDGYRFSGQKAEPKPLPKFLRKLLKKVNKVMNTDFNGILVNRYEDGTETIGAHSDDEKGLGKNGSVVGISLGAERVMRFRSKKTPLDIDGKKYLDMPSGCLFVMEGDFQKEFTHEIPAQKKVTETRISLTFRKHIN